ncbi:N-6 DNA methylase [Paludibaculum fermentans]|uniref:N-6 DNA methylase n=1 Tax=Paludibaculum fermentans TaxID=1473598 RepID=UPI003EBFD07E
MLFLNQDPTAAHLDYLDLFRRRNSLVLPDAVAEFQGRPLLYMVNGGTLDRQAILGLQRMLANRGDHACLGVVKPGTLDVYPINLNPQALAQADLKTVLLTDDGAAGFFQSLATRNFELPGQPAEADYVYDTIHRLLATTSEELAGTGDKPGPLLGLDVLSTTGRALFFRFLIDRHIVRETDLTEVCPSAKALRDAFSTAQAAAETSCWLDETFNGDLLPLGLPQGLHGTRASRLRAYQTYYERAGNKTNRRVFLHLQAILKRWENAGSGSFQTTLDWDQFDFAHIPIGVLSQVYQSFSHQWDEELARSTSVHYTPRHIAKFMVDEAFANVKNPSGAVVLDPACGAGVFLVLAFRRLVAEYWKQYGTRPNTRAIQRILYTQLRGFEVSESALRLAALALYITAIEVNSSPRPPASLKFPRPLRGEVLFDFGEHGNDLACRFGLGSLAHTVPESFNGSFDVVVTNPPWTRLRPSAKDPARKAAESKAIVKANKVFTEISRRVLISRGLTDLATMYENPDNDPDLPFVWRAAEWARTGGIIAMALPARIVLRQSPPGRTARNAILCGFAVTGILNGSDLEETKVWPGMKMPFMILFCRNAIPGPDHQFHFITPLRENQRSSIGQFRIDYKSAHTLSSSAVVEKPWLLKALAVGTVLDVEVTDKLAGETVGAFWERLGLHSGLGYNLSPSLKQSPAAHLLDLDDFERPEGSFEISRGVSKWHDRHGRTTAHMPRSERLYQPPLVVVPQSPREGRSDAKAFLRLESPLAFSQSNYGFSAAQAEDGAVLASTLYLIIHSQLFGHYCLMRSSRQGGSSYRTIVKEDIESFPLPEMRALSASQRIRIETLARELKASKEKQPWEQIDQLIFELYGLDEHDATVVRDTVTFCGPYRSVREPAESPITPVDLHVFCAYLQEMLQALFRLPDERIHVRPLPHKPEFGFAAWQFVSVTTQSSPATIARPWLSRLMKEASATGASRVTLRVPGGLLIGILNQRRFWTRSRARLCSLYVEEHHLEALDG